MERLVWDGVDLDYDWTCRYATDDDQNSEFSLYILFFWTNERVIHTYCTRNRAPTNIDTYSAGFGR